MRPATEPNSCGGDVVVFLLSGPALHVFRSVLAVPSNLIPVNAVSFYLSHTNSVFSGRGLCEARNLNTVKWKEVVFQDGKLQ